MNELLSPKVNQLEIDQVGSLIDADVGAYYTWLNQQRLPEAEKSLGHFFAFRKSQRR